MNCSSTVAASSAMIIVSFGAEGKGDRMSYVMGIEGRYMAGAKSLLGVEGMFGIGRWNVVTLRLRRESQGEAQIWPC